MRLLCEIPNKQILTYRPRKFGCSTDLVQQLDLPLTTLKVFPRDPYQNFPMAELLNGTLFDYEVSTEPRTFTNVRQIHFNTAEHTVRRILILKLIVAAKHKSPKSFTFVPVFVTTQDLILDPSTCDMVGSLTNGKVQLNPSFVEKHERGSKRIRPKTIKFELDDHLNLLDDLDIPDPQSDTEPEEEYVRPVARKLAAKKFPKYFGKRPRTPGEDVLDSGDEEAHKEGGESPLPQEDPGSQTDLDSDQEDQEDRLPRLPSFKRLKA